MAINLTKGQRVDVGLQRINVGLGWDPNPNSAGEDFDLDAAAFCVGQGGRCPSSDWFVFYNNLSSPSGAVEHTGDIREGGC